MRRPSATVRIQEAFLELLRERPHGTMSVSEIARRAQVNRVTFYRLFGSLEAVVSSMIDAYVEQNNLLAKDIETNPVDAKGTIRQMIENYLKYAPTLRIILESDYAPLLERRLEQRVKETIRRYSAAHGMTEPSSELLVSFYAAGITHVISDWTRQGCKETVDELLNLIIRSTALFER